MNRNITILALCQAVMMTANSLLVASSALVGYALATDKAWATLPLALQFLATMLTSIPASLLMQRIGRRGGFVLGTLIALSGAALATWAILHAQFALFCTGAVLIGVFNGFGIYYRFTAVEVAEEGFKNKAISYVMAGGVVAAFAGPNLARMSRDAVAAAPFAGSYAALVLLYLIALGALSLSRLPGASPRVGVSGGRPLRVIAAQPLFIGSVLGATLGYSIMSLVMTATPLAMQGCGLNFASTATVIQWHVFAMFAPSFVTGALINRLGAPGVMLLGGLMYVGCVAINLAGVSLWHFWLALFLLGAGWNFLFVGATSLLTETYAEVERGKVQALNDFTVFSAVTVASLSAGALQHQFGWYAVNLGVTPLVASALIVALLTYRQHRLTALRTA